ncbi:MAG TPA: hypothetical protein DEP53_00820 [Bacteroidetes bacterium]|nr:MAG: hypothetical protein A2X66_03005 [Ignavibacteria bacterium GWA2_54_16]HCA78253.1 hypothetical protein [Bacteroidota bacterium]
MQDVIFPRGSIRFDGAHLSVDDRLPKGDSHTDSVRNTIRGFVGGTIEVGFRLNVVPVSGRTRSLSLSILFITSRGIATVLRARYLLIRP